MRVVQVGLGGWGKGWAEIVGAAADVQLAAVVDPSPASRQWAVERLGLADADCYESLDEALNRSDCGGVLVVTPPETHKAVAEMALRAGKHVLIEKPLATTLPDAAFLIRAAAEADRVLMVSQNFRFRRPARAVRQLIAKGTLGRLSAINAVCRRDLRPFWSPEDFRYQMRHPYLLEMAIHHFDLIRALTGQNVSHLYGRSWRVPDSPYRHDPAMTALMALEGGATVTYSGTWAAYDSETSWDGDWEFVGEKGRLLWTGTEADIYTAELTLQLWGQPARVIEQPQISLTDRAATLHEFRSAIEQRTQPETDAADNIHSLAIVAGCVESIERNTLVDIADLTRRSMGEGAPATGPDAR